MLVAGLEPARPCERGILSPLRLPFRHTSIWRYHPDLNRGMRVLQTLALPLGYVTVWKKEQNHCSFFICGAGDEARTRYLHLGKVALYQMSYARKWCLRSESNQRHADFQSAALPTELQRHIKPLLQPDNGDHEGTRTLDLRRDRPAF